jgi:hypothetical protein
MFVTEMKWSKNTERYKNSISPVREVNKIMSLLTETMDQTEKDRKGIHRLYRISTSAGYVLTSAQDAMTFNNFHEGIHLGVILGHRKLV